MTEKKWHLLLAKKKIRTNQNLYTEKQTFLYSNYDELWFGKLDASQRAKDVTSGVLKQKSVH